MIVPGCRNCRDIAKEVPAEHVEHQDPGHHRVECPDAVCFHDPSRRTS